MKVSKEGKSDIKGSEALRLVAYPDPGSKDGLPWTIGYGATGPDITKGTVWTKEQAEARFEKDLSDREKAVSSLIKVPVDQCQFDAIISLIYNIGVDAFRKSTLLKLLNKADYFGAADQFLVWKYNDGKVMPGLVARRKRERLKFLGIH